MGHEIQGYINKVKTSMFDLYRVDIGLSSSAYDIDTKNKPYYIMIDELDKIKPIKNCNDIECNNIIQDI